MTRDEITQLAREAKLHLPYWNDDQNPSVDPPAGWAMVSPIGPALERFAALVEARTASLSAALLQSKDAQIEACRAETARWRYVAHTLGDYCVVDAAENTIGVLKGAALDAVVDAAIQARAAASIGAKGDGPTPASDPQ